MQFSLFSYNKSTIIQLRIRNSYCKIVHVTHMKKGIQDTRLVCGEQRRNAYQIFINLNSATSTIRCCKCIVVIQYYLLRGLAAHFSQKKMRLTAWSFTYTSYSIGGLDSASNYQEIPYQIKISSQKEKMSNGKTNKKIKYFIW